MAMGEQCGDGNILTAKNEMRVGGFMVPKVNLVNDVSNVGTLKYLMYGCKPWKPTSYFALQSHPRWVGNSPQFT